MTLMDKSDAELKDIGSGIIEAHTKGMIITMKKNDIENDRETLAERIQLMSAKDLRNMGLEIRSLVVKEVK